MRRLLTIAILLIFLFLIPWNEVGAENTEFYCFWEIPFGITMEECKKDVLRTQNIELIEPDQSRSTLVPNNPASVEYLGYPAEIKFLFDNNELESVAILLTPDTESTERYVDFYFEISKKLGEQYGPMTDGVVVKIHPDRSFDYPMIDGERNIAEIYRILRLQQPVTIREDYKNIRWCLVQGGPYPGTMHILMYVGSSLYSIPETPFIGLNGEYTDEF